MSRNVQKLILLSLLAILLTTLAFIIGVAFGAEISPNTLTNTYIPIFSMAGSWLSGIGALAAVITALWLAERQRREDTDKLKLNCDFAVTPYSNGAVIVISATSIGNRPASINALNLKTSSSYKQYAVMKFNPAGATLPTKLEYGEKALFICVDGFEHEIGKFINNHLHGKIDDLTICVCTTTQDFELKTSEDFFQSIKQASKESNISSGLQSASG